MLKYAVKNRNNYNETKIMLNSLTHDISVLHYTKGIILKDVNSILIMKKPLMTNMWPEDQLNITFTSEVINCF